MKLLLPRDPARTSVRSGRPGRAFSLLEVLLAVAIFFTVTFAILGVVTTTLRNAQALKRIPVDAGMLASWLSMTNKLEEGSESGDFDDFGKVYDEYRWERAVTEVSSNGLFQVDFAVYRRGAQDAESKLTILMWRPDSKPGSMSGGLGGGLRR